MRRDPLYIALVVLLVLLALHLAKVLLFTVSWPVLAIVVIVALIFALR